MRMDSWGQQEVDSWEIYSSRVWGRLGALWSDGLVGRITANTENGGKTKETEIRRDGSASSAAVGREVTVVEGGVVMIGARVRLGCIILHFSPHDVDVDADFHELE